MTTKVVRVVDELPAVKAALVAEQKNRHIHTEWVAARRGGVELQWMAAERDVMLREANRLRAHVGLDAVTVSEIERVEQMAAGHCDYTVKFALYVTELGLGHLSLKTENAR